MRGKRKLRRCPADYRVYVHLQASRLRHLLEGSLARYLGNCIYWYMYLTSMLLSHAITTEGTPPQ